MAQRIYKDFKPEREPIFRVDSIAYSKMLLYVMNNKDEVAWHGLVSRGAGDMDHVFTLEEVFLFPQKVTGASVTVDDYEYSAWFMNGIGNDPERLKRFRFHGHSHPNFSVFPSGTDREYREDMTENRKENSDDFFIFLIMNKYGNYSLELYDFKDMMKYETEEIEFVVMASGKPANSFVLTDVLDDITSNVVNEGNCKTCLRHPVSYFEDADTSDIDSFNELVFGRPVASGTKQGEE